YFNIVIDTNIVNPGHAGRDTTRSTVAAYENGATAGPPTRPHRLAVGGNHNQGRTLATAARTERAQTAAARQRRATRAPRRGGRRSGPRRANKRARLAAARLEAVLHTASWPQHLDNRPRLRAHAHPDPYGVRPTGPCKQIKTPSPGDGVFIC